MTRRLLLLSNSTLYGGGYLDHAAAEIADEAKPVADVTARLT